jgi:hypothetical protein
VEVVQVGVPAQFAMALQAAVENVPVTPVDSFFAMSSAQSKRSRVGA